MSGRNALAWGILPADPDNPLAQGAPTPADAWNYNAPVLRDAWAAARDPQTWQDAAQQYGSALLAGTAGPEGKGLGLDAAALKVLRDMSHPTGATMDNPAFARWFGKSQAVDEAGNPLTLYHGTGAKSISQFKDSKIGSANDEGFYGRGFYSAVDKRLATDYIPDRSGKPSGSVQELHYKVENPFIWDVSTPEAQADTIARLQAIVPDAQVTTTGINQIRTDPAAFTKALQGAGHDGVFVMSPKNYDAYQMGDWKNVGSEISEAVAFDPKQIKSANKNRGTYDPNDPRIKYGIAGLMAGGAATQAPSQ